MQCNAMHISFVHNGLLIINYHLAIKGQSQLIDHQLSAHRLSAISSQQFSEIAFFTTPCQLRATSIAFPAVICSVIMTKLSMHDSPVSISSWNTTRGSASITRVTTSNLTPLFTDISACIDFVRVVPCLFFAILRLKRCPRNTTADRIPGGFRAIGR